MDLFQRKRVELAADGDWVTGNDVPALLAGSLKVRGLSSDAARDAFNVKARAATKAMRGPDGSVLPSAHAKHTREVLSEVCILDAADLPFDAAKIRTMLLDPGYEALITTCIAACQTVDARSQDLDAEGLSGNS